MSNYFRQIKLILTAFPIFLAVVLSGCGGGGGGSAAPATTSSTVSGSVVKGPVTGAAVTFFALNTDGSKGAQLETATTDASGNYTVTLTPAPTTPFLAETSGGTYVDEATGATVTLAATDKLSAALPAGTTRATVTPLTDIAAARAQALAAGGTSLATAVDSSNMGVAAQYGIADIVTTLPPAANNANSAASTPDERVYALVLAGIAQQASSVGVRAIDLVNALAEDAKDGVLDGKNGTATINVPTISGDSLPLQATAGTTNIQTAINTFVASVNNKTNITQVNIPLTPVKLGVNSAGMLYSSSPVLPATVSGKTYTATLSAKGGTPPYTCALKAGSSLPPGFSLVPSTCQITGTAPIVTSLSITGPILITLTDSAMPVNSVDFAPLYLTVDEPQGTLWTGTFSGTEHCKSYLPGQEPPRNDWFSINIQNGVITGMGIMSYATFVTVPETVTGAVAGTDITFLVTINSGAEPFLPYYYSFTGTINGSQANGTWSVTESQIGCSGGVVSGGGTWSAHSVPQ